MKLFKYSVGLGQCGFNIGNLLLHKLSERMLRVDFDVRTSYRYEGDNIVLDKNGSGGDSEKGREYFLSIAHRVKAMISSNIINKNDKLLIIAGGGNGSGNGSILPCIDICKELNIKPFIFFTLPKPEEGLSTKKVAISKLIEIYNDYFDSIDGLLVIDNDYIASKLEEKKAGFTVINNYILDKLMYLINITNDISTVYLNSFKVFDYNDFVSLLTNCGNINFYELNLYNVNLTNLEDSLKKDLPKGAIFNVNANFWQMKSGVCLLEIPKDFTDLLANKYIDEIYKFFVDKVKLSKKFVFTVIKSDNFKIFLLGTGITLNQKINSDVKVLTNNVKKYQQKTKQEKVNIDLNFEL